MITVVLADDHTIVRQGIKALLEKEPGFQVIGEASSGEEAIKLLKERPPQVLVTDLKMGGMSGIEVARRASKLSPKTAVIVLSMYGASGYVAEALKAGATGYVLKGSDSAELVAAVREVSEGRRYLSPSISEKDVAEYMEKSKPTSNPQRKWPTS